MSSGANLLVHDLQTKRTSLHAAAYNRHVETSGVSSMELRELEHPPQLWHNSETSISVITINTLNRKLVAPTNNKLTAL